MRSNHIFCCKHCILNVVIFVGDVNNDTFADIIIGAPRAKNALGIESGVVYIIYGSYRRIEILLADLATNAHLGFVINGALAHDRCGLSVSGAGNKQF